MAKNTNTTVAATEAQVVVAEAPFAYSEAEAEALANALSAMAAADAPAKAGRAARKYGESAVITLVAEKNPKRPGAKAEARFALYRTGMTVGEFTDACVALQGGKKTQYLVDVAWDAERNFISVA